MPTPRAYRPVVAGLVVCAGLLTPPLARLAQAQSPCDGRGTYHLRLAPSAIDYGTVTEVDLEAGWILAGSMTVRIVPRGRRFKEWALCLRGADGRFGPGGKPIGDVEWQVSGQSGWNGLSTGDQLVASGSGRTDLEVFFRVAVAWEDAPGDYDALLAFHLASR